MNKKENAFSPTWIKNKMHFHKFFSRKASQHSLLCQEVDCISGKGFTRANWCKWHLHRNNCFTYLAKNSGVRVIVIHLKVQGTESAVLLKKKKKRPRNNERQNVIVVKKQKKKKQKKSPQRLSCLGISATLVKFSFFSLDREWNF